MKDILSDEFDISNMDFVPWERMKNKSVFITGATGLIGRALILLLAEANVRYELNISIIALVRDENRARERFGTDIKGLKLVVGRVEEFTDLPNELINFVIHGASQTASREFMDHPVETLETAVIGTNNILKLARAKNVESFVYLSSMEMYGCPPKGHKVTEDEVGAFSPTNNRNCYPIGKIASESLCYSYSSEYSLPVKIIRLTQTIGCGVNYNDNRVFAYFKKCADKKKDIVLRTKGETERSYLNVYDAASAILTLLLCGNNGEAYNTADETTYCSIAQMAEMIAKENGISVKYDIENEKINGFPETLYMDLDTTKIRKLGWKPVVHIGRCRST